MGAQLPEFRETGLDGGGEMIWSVSEAVSKLGLYQKVKVAMEKNQVYGFRLSECVVHR
jgi:hypothetical protein